MFCAVWFSANVTINAALAQTSVSSVTILSSLSGLFTLVLGAFFKIETFNLVKLLAVIARYVIGRPPNALLCDLSWAPVHSILGVILVSAADNEITPAVADPAPTFDIRSALLLNDGEQKLPAHPLLGDLLALSSALCYAIYTLLLKAKTGDESRVSMTLFFGFVGAWNIVLFLPLLLIVNFTGLEPLQWPRSNELWVFLIVNAAITLYVSKPLALLAYSTTVADHLCAEQRLGYGNDVGNAADLAALRHTRPESDYPARRLRRPDTRDKDRRLDALRWRIAHPGRFHRCRILGRF